MTTACTYPMQDQRVCQRPFFRESPGGPRCSLHSQLKDRETFWLEIDAILKSPTDPLDFSGMTFPSPPAGYGFQHVTFDRDVSFQDAAFQEPISFADATFAGGALFFKTRFCESVSFDRAKFRGESTFVSCSFEEAASFQETDFAGEANFANARFFESASFLRSHFHKQAVFITTTFQHSATFDASIFEEKANFMIATFKQPALVSFCGANQDTKAGLRIQLIGCNIQDIDFKDVRWNRNKRGRLLLDEPLDIPQRYEILADLYQRLIDNFKKAGSYDLAADCFYGLMEAKRLAPSTPTLERITATFAVLWRRLKDLA